jgi:mono/diheme cytochrome c family protein
MKALKYCIAAGLFALGTANSASGLDKAAEALYQRHCAACHGAQRLGGIGPALLPQNLSRLRKKAALEVIGQGRPLTQMPAFSGQLDDAELDALADFIYQPPAEEPNWGLADIRASHVVHHPKGSLGDKPVFEADLQNLLLRPARRPQVQQRRTLRVFCFPGRLDLQVRYLQPESRGGDTGRHQYPQRGGVLQQQVCGGGQLPAPQPGAAERRC